jgi:hypothetical protein
MVSRRDNGEFGVTGPGVNGSKETVEVGVTSRPFVQNFSIPALEKLGMSQGPNFLKARAIDSASS